MSCSIESPCDPQPEWCRRLAMPYVGKLGWFFHLFNLVPFIWFTGMLIGVFDQDHRVVVGVLSAAILVALFAWIINYVNNAPCFSNINVPSCDNPCGCELIIKGAPCDFAIRVKHALRHNGDQELFQVSLLGGLFSFIVFGAFITHWGTDAFNYVSSDFASQDNGHIQVMFFTIAKFIQGLIVLVYVNSFRLLTVTTADSIFRFVTAIPEAPSKTETVNNDSVTYGNKAPTTSNTKTRKSVMDHF